MSGLSALGFSLSSLENFEDEKLASAVLKRFLQTVVALRPTHFDIYEPIARRIENGDVQMLCEMWLKPVYANAPDRREGGLLLVNATPARFQIGWQKSTDPVFSFIGGDIPLNVASDASILDSFVTLVKDLAILINAAYGEVRNLSFKGSDLPFNLQRRLPDIPWASIYGEPYTSMFGEEKLRSAPFHRVESVGGSHLWAEVGESPFESVVESKKSAIRAFLGEDAFMSGGRWRYSNGAAPDFDMSRVLIK